jgi:hypothetical protein
MIHDVFISHSPHDCDAADAACAALEQRGISCWIAPRDVLPGQEHGEAIAGAIGGSRLLLLIFSAETNESVHARREVEQAGGQGLPVLAFRIADTAPAPALLFLIGEGQWLDALTPPIAPHLDYLGDRVAKLLDDAGRGPLLPTLPPRPFPTARRSHAWLPIVLAGLAGLAAIALAAAYVAPGGGAAARP